MRDAWAGAGRNCARSAAIAAGCRDIALPALNGRLRVRRVGRMADYQRFERRSEWVGRRRAILRGGRDG